jgi:hypothetical protein
VPLLTKSKPIDASGAPIDPATTSEVISWHARGHRVVNAGFVLLIALLVASCSTTPPSTPSPSQASQGNDDLAASPEATASPSEVAEPDGTFVFTPGAMDCPGNPGGLCPSYTVAEAMAVPRQPGIPIAVDGYVLIEPDGSAWFCERLSADSPPSCDGTRLRFENLELFAPSPQDLEAHGMQELDGVRWSEQVQLLGEVTP